MIIHKTVISPISKKKKLRIQRSSEGRVEMDFTAIKLFCMIQITIYWSKCIECTKTRRNLNVSVDFG